jgi:hypothetical protein
MTWRKSYEHVKRQREEARNLSQFWSFIYAGDLWDELGTCTEELGEETAVPEWLIQGQLAMLCIPFYTIGAAT